MSSWCGHSHVCQAHASVWRRKTMVFWFSLRWWSLTSFVHRKEDSLFHSKLPWFFFFLWLAFEFPWFKKWSRNYLVVITEPRITLSDLPQPLWSLLTFPRTAVIRNEVHQLLWSNTSHYPILLWNIMIHSNKHHAVRMTVITDWTDPKELVIQSTCTEQAVHYAATTFWPFWSSWYMLYHTGIMKLPSFSIAC